MFERFTDRARQVVVLAQEEARLSGWDIVQPEHLLVALWREGESIASRVLDEYFTDQDVDGLRSVLYTQGQGWHGGMIRMDKSALLVVERSLREALTLNHNYIGPEHILLGLVEVSGSILQELDIDPEDVHVDIMAALASPKPVAEPPPLMTVRVARHPNEIARAVETLDDRKRGLEVLIERWQGWLFDAEKNAAEFNQKILDAEEEIGQIDLVLDRLAA